MKYLGILLLCLAVVLFPAVMHLAGLFPMRRDRFWTWLAICSTRGRYYDLDFVSGTDADQAGSLNRHNYYGDRFPRRSGLHQTTMSRCSLSSTRLIFMGQEYRYNTIQTGEDVKPEDITLGDGTVLPLRRNTDEAWEPHLRQAWMDVKFPGADIASQIWPPSRLSWVMVFTPTPISLPFSVTSSTRLWAMISLRSAPAR